MLSLAEFRRVRRELSRRNHSDRLDELRAELAKWEPHYGWARGVIKKYRRGVGEVDAREKLRLLHEYERAGQIAGECFGLRAQIRRTEAALAEAESRIALALRGA